MTHRVGPKRSGIATSRPFLNLLAVLLFDKLLEAEGKSGTETAGARGKKSHQLAKTMFHLNAAGQAGARPPSAPAACGCRLARPARQRHDLVLEGGVLPR